MKKTKKTGLLVECQKYLDVRINRILVSIKDLENSLSGETKSSAGDKYETGREMINAEIEKLSGQLKEFKKLEEVLQIAERNQNHKEINLGSVVETSTANYFIAIPAGEITFENGKFYAIGANSPVAKVLLGKTAGEEFTFNGMSNKINSVN